MIERRYSVYKYNTCIVRAMYKDVYITDKIFKNVYITNKIFKNAEYLHNYIQCTLYLFLCMYRIPQRDMCM